MMATLRVDIVHGFRTNPPSLNNLLQGLETIIDTPNIHVHSLSQPDFAGPDRLVAGVELAALSFQTVATFAKVWARSDLVIIHKSLTKEFIEYIFGINVAERLFLRGGPTIHTTYDADYVHFPEKTRYLYERADAVVATSEAIYTEVEQIAGPDRVWYIPPSVDTDFFNPNVLVESSLETDSYVLGWVGNPDVHLDNLRYLAERLQGVETDDVTLRMLLGGGQLSQSVQADLTDTGLTLDLVDHVAREKVPMVINSFDVGLAPLRDTEFNRGRSSEKIREYMACGIPVIGSPVGENSRLIPDETGILATSPSEWRDAIAIMRNEDIRHSMGTAARRHVQCNYDTTVIAASFEELFNHVNGSANADLLTETETSQVM